MKKFIALAIAGSMMAGMAAVSYSAEKTVHEMCKEEAAKKMVPKDKVDAYVQECVKKHEKMGATSSPGSMSGGTSSPAK